MSHSDSKSGCSLAEYLQSVCTTRLVPVAQVGQAEMERQSAASKGVRWGDYFSVVGTTCGAGHSICCAIFHYVLDIR